MPVLLGFCGPLGSGKDEACSQLDEWETNRGFNLVRRGFADMLKVSAARAIGVDESRSVQECVDFCNHLKQDGMFVNVHIAGGGWSISGRQYLQLYGTEAHRKVFGTDFWVDALLPLVDDESFYYNASWHKNFGEGFDIAAIPDVRFDNEAKRIKDLGGYIIRMERDGCGGGDHASEAGISEKYVDSVIKNNGSLWDLQQEVVGEFDNFLWRNESLIESLFDNSPKLKRRY